METKKSKVLKVIHNTGSYQGKFGMMYKHQITFENGDKGEYQSKTETCTKFSEGLDSDYTIETKVSGQYTNTIIKPLHQEQQTTSFSGKKIFSGNQSFALSYAKDIACAHISSGKDFKSSQVTEVAEAFYIWLESKNN